MEGVSDENTLPEATQVTYKYVYDWPITRNHAKLLQKEVISFLAETNFNIHENIILPKNSILILLRCPHKEKDQIGQPDRTARSDQFSSDLQIRPITLDSRKIERPISTRWKAYEVYFPTQQVSCHFDFPIRIYGPIIEDWTEGQESARGFFLLEFPCKTVPFYNI